MEIIINASPITRRGVEHLMMGESYSLANTPCTRTSLFGDSFHVCINHVLLAGTTLQELQV